jgi:hypothetical protein
VGVRKGGFGIEDHHSVAKQLVSSNVNLVANHMFHSEQKILNGDVLLHGVGFTVDFTQPVSREVEHSLTKGFARYRPCVYANAAQDSPSLNEGRLLAQFRGLDSSALSCRT